VRPDRPWLDPRGLGFAVALAVLAACANGVWILLDSTTPSWDQSYYLSVALAYRDAFEAGGVGDLLDAIRTTDPAHGPLFTVLLWPLVSLFGPGPRSALLLDFLLSPLLYLAVGQIAWLLFRSWVARLLAIGLVATMPLIVGLGHEILVDYLLVTLTAVSLWLLLLSDGFRRLGMAVAAGVAMGLGTLTKVTFPAFVAGPLLVVVAGIALERLRSREGAGAAGRQPSLGLLARNAGGALLAYAAVVAPWYAINFDATLDYVRSTTSGPLSEGAGPEDPLAFDAIATFTLGVANAHVSWIVLLAGLLAAALCAPRIGALLRRPLDPLPLFSLAFLLAWVLVPFVSVATAHNQDVRLMAPALPGIAVLAAGAMSAVPRPRARLALIAVTGALLVYQTANHTTAIDASVLPEQLDARVGSYEAVIPLDSDPIGYERLPGDDYGTPVIDYMAAVGGEGGEPGVPPTACLLESEPIVNANTFRYLASANEAEFGFVDVTVGPGERGALRERLAECDLALYVRKPGENPDLAGSRLQIVNEEYAARYMTPRLIALFGGPSRTFLVGEPLASRGENAYLTTSGSGARVRVLTRRRDR
jgi:4-amino-4-deoxy-L-arabinose transferase-like glycosyltransferase